MQRIKMVACAGIIIGLFCPLVAQAQQTAIFGFAQSWVDPQADFKAYPEIYFRNFDLRDIHVKIYDSDGDLRQDRISAEAMQQIGLTMFRGFTDQMDGVITVNMEDLEIKDLNARKILVVDLNISGSYETEEERLLMKMIKGDAKRPMALTIEGKISDSSTGKELMTFLDKKDIPEISNDPFEGPSDLEKFSLLIDQWAGYLKDFLAKKRK